jgi:hypothetical protein
LLGKEVVDKPDDPLVGRGCERSPDERGRLGEAFLPVGAYGGQAPVLVHASSSRGRGMKVGELARDPPHQAATDSITGQQSRQHPALWHPAHPDGRLDWPPRSSHEVGAVSLDNLDDAEVQVRAKAPVQSDLVGADRFAAFACGEVEEAKIDRLLDLVGERPGQDDPGGVGLMQLQAVSRVRVCVRAEEGQDQGWKRELRIGRGLR